MKILLFRKKTLFISVLASFLASIQSAQAATLYLEDFSASENKGAIGTNLTNATKNPPVINTTGVNWIIENISSNGDTNIDTPGQADLTSTSDWFKVTNGAFEGQDLDGAAIWKSPVINISGYSNLAFTINFSESGELEETGTVNLDYVDVNYNLQTTVGGSTATNSILIPNQNNYSASSHTLLGDFNTHTISKSGISGNQLQIMVTMQNSALTEQIRFDNILVESNVPFDFSPSLGLFVVGVFGSISYCAKRNQLT